jgi:predicted TIM-barrel fold metal-dependent hydrolase
LFAAIRKWFADKSDWQLNHPTEPEEVCKVLQEFGVTRFAFCSYAHKPGIAEALNAWVVDTAEKIKWYGLPLATVHPADKECVEYVVEAFEKGCVGLKIHEDVQQFEVNDSRLKEIYRVVAEFDGFVLAHIGPIPWDYTPKRAPDRVAQILGENPGVKFVVAHFGAPNTLEYLKLMAEHENLFMDTTMAFALHPKLKDEIDPQLLEKHSERILFGSDFPNIPYEYDHERKMLERLTLSEKAKKDIFHDNAAKLLRLDIKAMPEF